MYKSDVVILFSKQCFVSWEHYIKFASCSMCFTAWWRRLGEIRCMSGLYRRLHCTEKYMENDANPIHWRVLINHSFFQFKSVIIIQYLLFCSFFFQWEYQIGTLHFKSKLIKLMTSTNKKGKDKQAKLKIMQIATVVRMFVDVNVCCRRNHLEIWIHKWANQ